MTIIEEISTITAKGQTTVPKAVRQALGLDYGGKIAYRIEDGRVVIHNAEAEHSDPALAAFLGLIEKEIPAGRNTVSAIRSAKRTGTGSVRNSSAASACSSDTTVGRALSSMPGSMTNALSASAAAGAIPTRRSAYLV